MPFEREIRGPRRALLMAVCGLAAAGLWPGEATAQFLPNIPGRSLGSQIIKPNTRAIAPRTGGAARVIIQPNSVLPGLMNPPRIGNTGPGQPGTTTVPGRTIRTPGQPPQQTGTGPPRVAIPCVGGTLRGQRCICPPRLELREGACVRIAAPQPPRVPPAVIVPPVVGVPPLITTPPPGQGLVPPLPPTGPLPAQLALDTYVPDEVLISVPAAAPQTLEEDLAQAYGLTILERATLSLIGTRVVRLRIPDQRRVVAVVTQLQADPRLGDAQENFYYRHQQGGPSSPAGELQYALVKVNLQGAHRLAIGQGAVVAVIDSGIDASHPDLAAAVAEEFDAIGDASAPMPGNLDPHGTAVAGIIAAEGTVQGVAPKARILSARAFSGAAGGATATTMSVIKSLDWAIGKGARVLNLSFAGPRDPLLQRGVEAAAAKRAIMVAAAGNGGPGAAPAYPAAYADVIAVTATDQHDRIYDKANRGGYISIAAPGVDILAPIAGRGHGFQSGTSFAAAHVSGIVALALELDPGLGQDTIRRALTSGAIDLGRPGHDEEYGAGRTNAVATLDLVRAEATRRASR